MAIQVRGQAICNAMAWFSRGKPLNLCNIGLVINTAVPSARGLMGNESPHPPCMILPMAVPQHQAITSKLGTLSTASNKLSFAN